MDGVWYAYAGNKTITASASIIMDSRRISEAMLNISHAFGAGDGTSGVYAVSGANGFGRASSSTSRLADHKVLPVPLK
jgi:hypothetical protein